MSRTWVIADPHFGHHNICNFLNPDGSKVRPWDNADDMDEALVANWNGVVGDKDRVYLLGDVAFSNRTIETVRRLKGRIVLIKGNHDTLKLNKYVDLFDDVRALDVKKGFVLSHAPVHPACLRRWGLNIHGHLHSHQVRFTYPVPSVEGWDTMNVPDPRYVCVSVERTGFTPVDLQEILDGEFK